MSEKEISRKDFNDQIIKKAQSDKEFKKALLADPKAALAKFGAQFPADFQVKVVEESAKVLYLVLPVNPDELTDDQLDSAAGGFLDCIGKGSCHTKICDGFKVF